MVLVFGAAGFIGTYLVDRLIECNYDVVVVDVNIEGLSYYNKLKIPCYKADISCEEDLLRLPVNNVEAIINLASVQPANVGKDSYKATDYVKVNTIGAINLLEFCVQNRIKKYCHVCSHRNTQGLWKEKEGVAIRESDGRSIKYTGDYAMFSISESAAIDCVEHYNQEFGLGGIIFRIPPVYGYGPHLEIYKSGRPVKTGFQIFIDKAKEGEPIEIWGDVNIGRDIIYVKDVVEAFILVLKKEGLSGVYNISSGKQLTLMEEVEGIVDEFHPLGIEQVNLCLPERLNGIESYYYDISKAKREFNWEPKYSYRDMLIDYRKEMESGRFSHLIEKRRLLMSEG